ncbi:ran-binding protein 3 [Octopus bimaculoides]|uniref:RanBD1 domain-containing protein n=1 Tax=Octopus bimaculoides TaxID=37653 RepID=A0A0L8GVN4_OCTBM|nr:ran-binding protein 3 [Octopus bimaculoides]XP_014777897.1 ran-binding protein 3 [Octopus bimaculoides]|eukprot:XP_014777895.1 PREDICTED: ran-binding protein 3-like [Octopus bimaculoides]
MADTEADPTQGSLESEPGSSNKEKLADSTTQDASPSVSESKTGDTNGVVSSTSSLGSCQSSSSSIASPQTVSSSFISPSRLRFCKPSVTVLGVSTSSNPVLAASKMMPNPFAPKASLKSETVSLASITSQSCEGIIAPSRFGASRQADPDSTDGKRSVFWNTSLLAPSKFNVQSSQNVHSLIKPATLPDPTNKNSVDKSQQDADSSSSKRVGDAAAPKENVSSNSDLNQQKTADGGITTTTGDNDTTSSSSSSSSSSSKFSTPIFSRVGNNNSPVNLHTGQTSVNNNTEAAAATTTTSTGGEFLFGTNLHERVVGLNQNSEKSNNCSGFVFGENLADRVVAADKPSSPLPDHNDSSEELTNTEKPCQSLEESAREYQMKHDVRTEYKEIEVKTGEEDESNVLQSNCKLFVFDKPTLVWIERGQGVLRLNDLVGNDSEKFQSRLVMRSQGSLRVILNTKIWTGMTVKKASQKSVRLTATDGDGVKVFLIVANPKDSDNIMRAIEWRIQQLKTEEEELEKRNASKRKSESQDRASPKKLKKLPELSASVSSVESKSISKEESDSSVLDPETEASNESYTSSQTVRSESD